MFHDAGRRAGLFQDDWIRPLAEVFMDRSLKTSLILFLMVFAHAAARIQADGAASLVDHQIFLQILQGKGMPDPLGPWK